MLSSSRRRAELDRLNAAMYAALSDAVSAVGSGWQHINTNEPPFIDDILSPAPSLPLYVFHPTLHPVHFFELTPAYTRKAARCGRRDSVPHVSWPSGRASSISCVCIKIPQRPTTLRKRRSCATSWTHLVHTT